jgi:anti-anti-sigma factor
MKIKSNEYGVAIYLAPDGPLVEDNIPAYEQAAREARDRGITHLVLDLKQVRVLDSKGLEFLLDLAGVLRGQGGSLRLASPNAICSEILELTDLDKTISVFADIESAGRSFL